ncbi:hypothetical protein [Nocardia sp. NPDC127526]|uniref:hypothetical protein n=1 Tax=Nocardia sp. NPDC127526 TaxID=3345393 RepID=UPI00362AFA32
MNANLRPDVPLVGPAGAVELLKEHVPQRKVPALLATGLLGTRYRHGAALLVAQDNVERAIGLPEVDMERLHAQMGAVFVTRQTCRTPVTDDPTRQWLGVDVFAPMAEQVAAADRWYSVSEQTRAAMRDRITTDGFVPLVSTVSGLVALCLEIIEVPTNSGQVRLGTRPAGAWAQEVTDRWLPTGPGGNWTWA